jgi:GT2 family glycosyltransferase
MVSIVLLSFNRPECLREALASLLQQSYENLEIIVVDNPSPSSDEVARLVSEYPNVKLIRNSHNLGYTGGMNIGIAQAAGDYVYLTEDDIVLEGGCIQRLVEYLDENPAADLIAPIMYDKTEKTIRCAGGNFELGAVYRMKIFGAGEFDMGQFPQPFAVTFINGATMFARRDFWQHFKGFREEYFMYGDEVELCARVIEAGRRMAVVPQAKVYHFEPLETAPSPEIEFHKIKNFFSLYLLHAPIRILPEFVLRYAVVNLRRAFSSDQKIIWPTIKAWSWVFLKSPALLSERFRHRKLPGFELKQRSAIETDEYLRSGADVSLPEIKVLTPKCSTNHPAK